MIEAGTLEDEVRRVLEQGRILSEELIAIKKEAAERTERAKHQAQEAMKRRARLRKRKKNLSEGKNTSILGSTANGIGRQARRNASSAPTA